MRYVAVSGHRSDRAAIDPVAEALGADRVFLTTPQSVTNADAARSFSRAVLDATDQFCYYEPDVVILPGDRFEMLAAACSAHLLHTVIAHIGGGDITEGSLDNSMRNCITKLAHLHFASSNTSALNIMLMGEEPWRVNVTGDPGIDGLAELELYSKDETSKKLGVGHSFILVAYQPATSHEDPLEEADQLLEALTKTRLPCVFTKLNTDPFAKLIERRFQRFCTDNMGTMIEMDRKLYLSAMKHCWVMVGNSSSGFYEAPTLKKAFVNVGDRQKGRLAGNSIISVVGHGDSIASAMLAASKLDCSSVRNVYGDGRATGRICKLLKELPERKVLLNKQSGDDGWFLMPFGNKFTNNALGEPTQKRSLLDGLPITSTVRKLDS